MEVYYPPGRTRGAMVDVIDAWTEVVGKEKRRVYSQNDFDEEEWTDGETLGRILLKEYRHHYGDERDIEVVHSEQSFQIDVVDKKGNLLAIYCGTWDLLVWDRIDKCFRLWDHKTSAKNPTGSWLSLNKQAGSYLWVAPEVLLGKGIWKTMHDIDGITFNYVRKALPDTRPQNAQGQALNKDGTVSARQPSPLFTRHQTFRSPHERVAQQRHVVAELKHMNAVRAGKLPVLKNVEDSCSRCPLFDVCELHERGDDWKDMLETTFVHRDPYADHREALREGDVFVITEVEK